MTPFAAKKPGVERDDQGRVIFTAGEDNAIRVSADIGTVMETALLAEVADWLERKAAEDMDLAGDEVSDHTDALRVESAAFKWIADKLRDGSWRS